MGHAHYTPKEDRAIRRGFREGLTDEQIAEQLDRTATGVKYRRIQMGLSRRGKSSVSQSRPRPTGWRVSIEGPGTKVSIDTDGETAHALLGLVMDGGGA